MSARYVEHGGLATAPGPLSCQGTTMFGFWADADRDSLKSICEEVFVAPSNGLVVPRPLLSKVLITFVRIDRVVSEPPAFARVGHVTEREVVIWLPTVVSRVPRFIPRRLRRFWLLPDYFPAAVIPSMWLDNPISIAAGRELYGYPKSWGCIASDPASALGATGAGAAGRDLPPRPARLALEAFGVERYGRDESPRCRPLLELTCVEDDDRVATQEGGIAALLHESRARLAPDAQLKLAGGRVSWRRRLLGALPERMVDEFLGSRTVHQFFLKQFRSAQHSDRASSQEIVRVPATDIEHFRFGLLPPYELRVHDLDSHPLCRRSTPSEPGALRLGLRDRQRIELAFVAQFDFRVELGEVLWRARAAR